ncbi:MAG: MFS transporter [Oscillospiraceae bacterium]
MAFSALIMFSTLHKVPESFRLIYFIGIYAVYTIGYTFQTACTKAAQVCLTNDPKQRPVFTLFDAIYNTLLSTGASVYVSNFLFGKYGAFSAELFSELVLTIVVLAGVFTLLAVIGISQKDKKEFFGLGSKENNIKFKDYLDVVKKNKAIQMLIFAASTDKLASSTMRNAVVLVIIFGVISGDYALYGQISAFTTIPILIIVMLGVKYASMLGQKKALVVSTWLSLALGVSLGYMVIFTDMTSLSFSNINLYTIIFCVAFILMGSFQSLSSNIVIPMIADCSDYETYKTGRYVPGMMGTLFSFVDKIISSFSTTIVGFILASIGFKEKLPTADTLLTKELLYVGCFLFVGMPIIGWISSLVAMKFYPLDANKMKEVQEKIQEIKELSQKSKV